MGKQYLLSRIKSSWNIKKIAPLLNYYIAPKTKFNNGGFTLVELLVVIVMIAIMISFLILFLDPFKQVQKARDSQRQQNLKQINGALDTYYNDNSCYPLSLSFGSSWQQGSQVYMKKIPQDPSCPGSSCYTYVTDTRPQSCPAWNILFAKIYQSSQNSSRCALEQVSNCLPSNYAASGYNYCILSGKVDCAYLNTITLPADAGAGTGGTGGGGGAGGGGGGGSCSKDYSCTGTPLRCNVISPAGSGQYCESNCNGVCP